MTSKSVIHSAETTGGDSKISVRALSKHFIPERGLRDILRGHTSPPIVAVQDVSFDIANGEVFGLVGPNGAGKTTLLRMLSTLLVPTSGSATIAGLDVVEHAKQVRQHIGMVASNERSFFWRLTGLQNLHFFADLYHLDKRDASRWIAELLDLLDLTPVANERFESYSTGTKQRFSIARGLLHRPQVLFMDEPTKGVDPKSSAGIIALIRERIVNHARQTVIITTHNLREIEQLCQRTLIMEHGRVAYLGTTSELKRTVVGTDAYRIAVHNTPPGLIEQLSAFSALPIQYYAPDVLDIRITSGTHALHQVMQTILASGTEIVDCTRVEIPIEDAFIAFLASRKAGLTPKEETPC